MCQKKKKKKFCSLKLMLSVIPFPVNRDWASPSGMHMQTGFFHMNSRGSYSMPFLSIWLAAISMTLMMNAMAKAQMRLFLTHVWRFFFEGWTEMKIKGKKRTLKTEIRTERAIWISVIPERKQLSPRFGVIKRRVMRSDFGNSDIHANICCLWWYELIAMAITILLSIFCSPL